MNLDEPIDSGFEGLKDPKLDLVSMKSKSSDGGILGLKKLAKRAKTL
jgi:hypothetical protein